MKRKISLICLFVVCLCCLCSVFAGCGGKDVGGKTDENVPSTEQTDDKNEQNDEHQPATDESFIITFYDENGKEIESRTWQANSVPNCDYEKADTKEWD